MLLAKENEDRKPSALIYILAALPTFDCILNQINTAFQIEFGPLSLLQVVRGIVLVLLATVLLWNLAEPEAKLTGLHLCAFGGLAFIAIALSKEGIVSGSVAMSSVGSYGQFAYWLVVGMVVASICRTRREAMILLYGIATGALATALSIFIGYFFGGLNPYQDDDVTASAGWFHTAKTITGVLLTGGVVVLYLGKKSKSWWSTILAGLCFVACIMTYARAGLVALGAAIAWLAFWWIVLGRGHRRQWLSKILLATVLLAGISVPALIRSQSWQSRWGDIEDPDKAGSGRATFWRIALENYSAGGTSEHIFGFGYSGMADLLLRGYGDDIKHTHNDFLDSMLVGGTVGMFWLVCWITYLFSKTVSISLSTLEGASAATIVLIYIVHGQFTGQLFGTDSMTYYVISLTCLYQIASLRGSDDAKDEEPASASRSYGLVTALS